MRAETAPPAQDELRSLWIDGSDRSLIFWDASGPHHMDTTSDFIAPPPPPEQGAWRYSGPRASTSDAQFDQLAVEASDAEREVHCRIATAARCFGRRARLPSTLFPLRTPL